MELFEKEIFTIQSTDRFFNQYNSVNPIVDRPNACEIRIANLKNYVKRLNQPSILLVGEAPGFKGMRCSGVPFVCEQQLLRSDFPISGKQSSQGKPKCEVSATLILFSTYELPN